MQDQNQKQTSDNDAKADDTVVVGVDDAAKTTDNADNKKAPVKTEGDSPDKVMAEVISKINDANNILVALSTNPTVDDLAAAIGLSLYLERAGKRAVAIYSGTTPNAMQFLKPADTLKTTADTLQDFVIAISKDKADHLRYKLDGDYVKIFITPYKTRIAEEDLEFSYGDFNIDLVVAINVASESELDNALREQGRVLHDATVINITTSEPGSFGKVEWSDPSSSSVSEMIAQLVYGISDSGAPVEKDDATALLTGIIAATDRFSGANTSPETMQTASRLMSSGADQKLITENITSDLKDKILELADNVKKAEAGVPASEEKPADEGVLVIEKENKPEEENEPEQESEPEKENESATEVAPSEGATPAIEAAEPDVKTAIPTTESTTPATETTAPTTESTTPATETTAPATESTESVAPTTWLTNEPSAEANSGLDNSSLPPVQTPLSSLGLAPANSGTEIKSETVVAPSADFAAEMSDNDPGKYGQMLQDALAELGGGNTAAVTPDASASAPGSNVGETIEPMSITTPTPEINNPAMSIAPPVAEKPEINGVPEINYASMPGDSILPPPPAPPIDINGMPPSTSGASASVLPEPAIAAPAVSTSDTIVQPAVGASTQPAEQPTGSSDFKIPGM